jgi:transcriptional regulator with XRE-family HTH domain
MFKAVNEPTKARATECDPRRTKNPPHVSLANLRLAAGLTIDSLIDRIEEETGHRYSRGTISAIESGHRGASAELLAAIATAYGLRPDAVRTDYTPRRAGVAA